MTGGEILQVTIIWVLILGYAITKIHEAYMVGKNDKSKGQRNG